MIDKELPTFSYSEWIYTKGQIEALTEIFKANQPHLSKCLRNALEDRVFPEDADSVMIMQMFETIESVLSGSSTISPLNEWILNAYACC